ncbi:hypothetical protein DMB66_00045 [Actinoplanes sp. ATCC 53533]|uniref:hypothetical protein n=1 Tax=Actinoplanes sp. ATCC 53533 TaxID=1288362 RepID=UPI000F7AD39C|nr:hypothetical protein [Actinoplanes sp. ATCC 53533]RSM75196.1 hypothetical protein DMB66_00045 [Actinoplanes sp. ATCC 53533]
MTQPAEITSRADWELLRINVHEVYEQIDDLYQRITDPGDDDDKKRDEKRDEKEEPVPDQNIDPDTDPDVQAEEDVERQRRLDYETDGELDGGYDPDVYDEPGLED